MLTKVKEMCIGDILDINIIDLNLFKCVSVEIT